MLFNWVVSLRADSYGVTDVWGKNGLFALCFHLVNMFQHFLELAVDVGQLVWNLRGRNWKRVGDLLLFEFYYALAGRKVRTQFSFFGFAEMLDG